MSFIIKETFIMKFGGLLMRIRILIGVRNGFSLDRGRLNPLRTLRNAALSAFRSFWGLIMLLPFIMLCPS